MALNNLGYREWHGKLTSGVTRWTVITETAVKSAWKSMWVRRLIVCALLPTLWLGMGFFFYEQALNNPLWRRAANELIHAFELSPGHVSAMQNSDISTEESRHYVWSTLLSAYLSNTQSFVMVLLVGLITPPMISQDFRSRAFLLYFSRPLERFEYLLGKSAAVWAYLGLISAVPGLLIFVMGVILSPRIEVLMSTWDLPLRILLASVFLSIPTTAMSLCFSSMTQESRYASFAWFLIWVIGTMSYGIIQGVTLQAAQDVSALNPSGWIYLSPYHVLQRIQLWVFGFYSFQDTMICLILVSAVTLLSYFVMYRRISAPMKA